MSVISGKTADHLDMIEGEVIQRLLAYKWNAYGAVSFELNCSCKLILRY